MTNPPNDLGPSGRALWAGVVQDWDLRPDELELLHAAARVRDRIDSLTEGMAGQPLTVLGAQRQVVIHPLITELRQHETALASLLARLKITDHLPDSGPSLVFADPPPNGGDGRARKMTRSEAGKKAANARWDKARAARAS